MKNIGWWPKNWRKLAKSIHLYPDDPRSLHDLMEEGVYSRATVWNMLFAGIRTRRYHKPVKESVLRACRETKNSYQHMTNEELLERDKEWERQYGRNRKISSDFNEDKYGVLGDLKRQKHHDDDEEDEDNY